LHWVVTLIAIEKHDNGNRQNAKIVE